MKFRIPVIFFFFIFFSGIQPGSYAQVQNVKIDSIKRVKGTPHWFDIGVGFGLDYGGLIGVKVGFHPAVEYLMAFVSGGYELIGLAWEAGVAAQYPAANNIHKVRGYIKVMYGANAVTKVTGAPDYNKIFYGVTPGIGLQLRFGRNRSDGLDLDLNFPLRSPEFFNQVSAMKNDKSIEMVTEPLPVAFSIGYHHEF